MKLEKVLGPSGSLAPNRQLPNHKGQSALPVFEGPSTPARNANRNSLSIDSRFRVKFAGSFFDLRLELRRSTNSPTYAKAQTRCAQQLPHATRSANRADAGGVFPGRPQA